MTEEIVKCRRCKRERKNEDWKGLKTCPICHEKDRADAKIRSADRSLDRAGQTLIESLQFSKPLPQSLQSFSNYQKFWREYGNGREVKAEEYFEELRQHKQKEIREQAETQISKTRGEFQRKKLVLTKFLRFDLFEPSNREQCTLVRLQKLGLFHEQENQITEHIQTCESCDAWLYNLMNDVLDDGNGTTVHLAYAKDFSSEKAFENRKKEINGTTVTIDEKLKKLTVIATGYSPVAEATRNVDKLDLWEEKKGLRPFDPSLLEERKPEPYPDRTMGQGQDSLRDYLQKQHDEQQQQEKPRGFLDRLRKRRDQNDR